MQREKTAGCLRLRQACARYDFDPVGSHFCRALAQPSLNGNVTASLKHGVKHLALIRVERAGSTAVTQAATASVRVSVSFICTSDKTIQRIRKALLAPRHTDGDFISG